MKIILFANLKTRVLSYSLKKNYSSDRMWVDNRKLYSATIEGSFPLPLIDDHIDTLGKHIFFTYLDMATGFHQIPLNKYSISLTGFVTSEGLYEYLKMLHGLAHAPVFYQHIMAKTFRHYLESGVTSYL